MAELAQFFARQRLLLNAGFQSAAVGKGALIEDCEFGYTGDDFINIHSRFDRHSPGTMLLCANNIIDCRLRLLVC